MKRMVTVLAAGMAIIGATSWGFGVSNHRMDVKLRNITSQVVQKKNKKNVTVALGGTTGSSQSGNSGSASPVTPATGTNLVQTAANNVTNPSTPTNPVVTNPTTPTTPTPPVTPPVVTLVGPSISITAPTNAATVSGTVTLSANASDDKGVSKVQFMLNGANLGAVDASAPYSTSWNTTTYANGSYSITAIATDTDNLTKTATTVTVTVNNVVVTPPVVPPTSANMISNPSAEDGTTMPTGWTAEGYGTNNRLFSYETNGHTGAHSLKTTITSWTDGDSKWSFAPVTVTAGTTYKYSNWYKSTVDTQVDVAVTMADGVTVQYFYVGAALASPSAWTQFNATYTIPAGATKVTFYHVLAKAGTLQTDDYSLSPYVAQKFGRAIVSLTFDDAWKSIYTNGLPLLAKYAFPSTQYLLTDPTIQGYADYMTQSEMLAFKTAGHELAGHTVHHCDLTGATTNAAQDDAACGQPISAANVNNELLQCKATLQAWFPGLTVTNFATPYGAYSSSVIAAIKAAGYTSHRSVDVGYNTKDNFDRYNIKVQNMLGTTTLADVQGWVNKAIADGSWLVIVYHEVSNTPEDTTYAVTPANLDAQLGFIKASGVQVSTVEQALNELVPQL